MIQNFLQWLSHITNEPHNDTKFRVIMILILQGFFGIMFLIGGTSLSQTIAQIIIGSIFSFIILTAIIKIIKRFT